MTTLFRLALVLLLATGLSACGKDIDLTCDDVRTYQLAAEGRRVQAPEGLDDLDPRKEMPLPEASPQAERPAGSSCIDRPPKVNLGS